MSAIPQLLGELDLELKPDKSGIARVHRRHQSFPLHFTAPMYLDDNVPEMAFIYVQNPSGAVFGEDRLRLRVAATDGAKVHVTTTSATKLHRMRNGLARQHVMLEAKSGSYIEYLPDPLIPQAESSYEQDTTIKIDTGSMLIASEIIAPGRLARGEAFSYNTLRLRTNLIVGGQMPLTDNLLLEPGILPVDVPGVLGSYLYFGSFLALMPGKNVQELTEATLEIPKGSDDYRLGIGPLSGGSGILARALAKSSATVMRLLDELWTRCRIPMIGAPAPTKRK